MPSFGTLAHVDPRDLWRNEATEFTPWLADQLEKLSEALGIDLELVERESAVGDFACDLLAQETGTNRPVIIENQLEPTNHQHLGQLLTYAGGLDAAVVIWISPAFRDEHRQALDWLNRHTDADVDFFGVALEAIRIDDSRPAVQFRPVAFPNEWRRRVVVERAVSDRQQAYKEFFQRLLDELRERHRFTNARVAQAQSWYFFNSGISGIHYTAAFASGNRLKTEFYIGTNDTARNKAIYDWLFERKQEIEEHFGEKLQWERLDHRQASRISAVRQSTSIADACTHGDDLREWLISHLLQLKAVFGPLLGDASTTRYAQSEVSSAAAVG